MCVKLLQTNTGKMQSYEQNKVSYDILHFKAFVAIVYTIFKVSFVFYKCFEYYNRLLKTYYVIFQ